MDINDYIISIKDFPKEGVIFRDITPLMLNAEAYTSTIKQMAALISAEHPTKILAAESRGFFFGPAIAYELGLPFMPIRKKGKLPRQTISAEYELEYGTDLLFAHKDDFAQKGERVAIIDDVLATGGTAKAMCQIAQKAGADIACLAFLLGLKGLGGIEKLSGYKTIIMKEV